MSKYIIELDDRIKLVTSVGVTENGVVYTTSDYVHNLEELNSDYINEHFGELQDEAYQRGFEDGRRKARGGCTWCEYESQTGECLPCDYCMNNFTNQWTAKHSDRIEVGDEVSTRDGAPSHTFLVTKVTDSHVYGISNDGSWNYYTKDSVTKTGKHYDIASILEAMRTHD